MPLPIPPTEPPRQPPRRPPPDRNSTPSPRLKFPGPQKPTASTRSSGRPRSIRRSGKISAQSFLAPAPIYPPLIRRERTRKVSTASRLYDDEGGVESLQPEALNICRSSSLLP